MYCIHCPGTMNAIATLIQDSLSHSTTSPRYAHLSRIDPNHAVAGRQGFIDAAVKTAETGYTSKHLKMSLCVMAGRSETL